MIVDCHTHLNKVAGGKIVDSVNVLCRHGDRHGIERFCLSLGFGREHSPTPDQVRLHNDQVCEALALRPDRLIGFVYLNPVHTDDALAELERCVVNGPMRGIKLWVACPCSYPCLDPVVERAIELDLPILQHTWLKATGNLPNESTAADIAELAARHPTAKLICGHTGGDWEHGIMAIRPHANVYADICGGAPYSGCVELAVAELGADRVLYGSDAPGRSFASQLAKVVGADVSDEDKNKLLGANILKLLAPERNPISRGTTAVPPATVTSPVAAPFAGCSHPVIDVNASLGNWPFRYLRDNSPEGLLAAMDRWGIDQAWVASLDAILNRETKTANSALAEAVAPHRDRLTPFAVINPNFPGWQSDLATCLDELGMCGVRTYPNYFGYTLENACFRELLSQVHERGVPLQIAVRVADERMHHPLVKVPAVDITELETHLAEAGDTPIILLNLRQGELAPATALCQAHSNVSLEISHVEVVGGVGRVLAEAPVGQVLFGTHAPILVPASSVLKVRESALEDDCIKALCHDNPRACCRPAKK